MNQKERLSRVADTIRNVLFNEFPEIVSAGHNPVQDKNYSARVSLTIADGSVYSLKISEWRAPDPAPRQGGNNVQG